VDVGSAFSRCRPVIVGQAAVHEVLNLVSDLFQREQKVVETAAPLDDAATVFQLSDVSGRHRPY
jgi:hypothetical protein